MEIDLGAIAANFREFRRRLGAGRRMIGVIKADAYGHGAVEIARTLSALGVDFLASGSLKESVGVRRAGISTPIILLGSLSREAIHDAIHHGAIPSVDSMTIAGELSRATTTPLSVFVKVDCGFGRFGIPITQAVAFVEHVLSLPYLKIEGIYTHLPFSDERGRNWAERQTREFDGLIAELAARGLTVPIAQSQASPGLSVGLTDNGTATALGHLLYGLSPVNAELTTTGTTPVLRPGLKSVNAKLIHAGESPKGAAAAPYLRGHHGRLGVVSIGIQHGYRPTSEEAHMIIRGSEAPLLRVCLENTIVDLSRIAEAQVGDMAIVVGSNGHISITLQDLAKWQATSQLALLTAFGKSLTRTYIAA
jgi:alanine racemase